MQYQKLNPEGEGLQVAPPRHSHRLKAKLDRGLALQL